MMNYNNLAVIPARGGSKGVPFKNIKLLNGIPLLAYTIKAALDSKLFDKVIVSTDDQRIAEVAKEYGAEVPFIRPDKISNDFASSDAVIEHALDFFEKGGITYERVCKLQPTSPLRDSEDLIGAYRLFDEKQADFVVSVCECEHSPLWSARVDENGSLDDFCRDEIRLSCRQKLDTYYRLNGAVYIANVAAFKREKSFFGKNGFAYIMPQMKSVDIDSEIDFKIAEVLMN